MTITLKIATIYIVLQKGDASVILKTAGNGEEFQRDAKKYVINMLSNARTLHIKNGCYHAQCCCKYYDFDTFEEEVNSGAEFLKCKRCFNK